MAVATLEAGWVGLQVGIWAERMAVLRGGTRVELMVADPEGPTAASTVVLTVDRRGASQEASMGALKEGWRAAREPVGVLMVAC